MDTWCHAHGACDAVRRIANDAGRLSGPFSRFGFNMPSHACWYDVFACGGRSHRSYLASNVAAAGCSLRAAAGGTQISKFVSGAGCCFPRQNAASGRRQKQQAASETHFVACCRQEQAMRPSWIRGRPLEHQRAHDSSGTSSGVLTPLMAELCIAHLHVC